MNIHSFLTRKSKAASDLAAIEVIKQTGNYKKTWDHFLLSQCKYCGMEGKSLSKLFALADKSKSQIDPGVSLSPTLDFRYDKAICDQCFFDLEIKFLMIEFL